MFSSVQSLSCPTLCNPGTAAHQASLSIRSSWSLLKFMSIELVMPSKHLLCRPLMLYIIIIFHHRYDDNMNLIALLWKLSVVNNGMGFWNL